MRFYPCSGNLEMERKKCLCDYAHYVTCRIRQFIQLPRGIHFLRRSTLRVFQDEELFESF